MNCGTHAVPTPQLLRVLVALPRDRQSEFERLFVSFPTVDNLRNWLLKPTMEMLSFLQKPQEAR